MMRFLLHVKLMSHSLHSFYSTSKFTVKEFIGEILHEPVHA